MHVLLVASTDPELSTMLKECGLSVTQASAEGLADLARPGAKPTELIVVDQRRGGALPPALATIRKQHPGIGVLLILPALEPALMLDAMRAGISECLAHPVSREDLKQAISRICAARPVSKRAEVFAIVGAKGGVGATTVAVNTATMLAKQGRAETLLIDLHVTYGDAAVYLGVEPRFSVADAVENLHRLDASMLKGLVTETAHGVHLLASSERPAALDPDVAQVRALIELAATQYAYIVLDVPRSSGAMLDALAAAGVIVLVANQELATVRSAARMASALQQRYGRERVQIVISRYDDRAEIGQRDVERVAGMRVRHLLPNNYAAVVASQNSGRPLVLETPSKLAGALTTFTRALAGLPEQVEPERAGGLFARIGRR
jgi:pilus assembly protein CpaE